MGWIIIIVVFIFILFMSGESTKEFEAKQKDLERRSGIKVIQTFDVNYIGGFKNISKCNKCVLEVCNDRLKVITMNTSGDIFSIPNNILMDYIQNVEIKTETEIKEKVSLGKLMFFGILAFGMNGKESTVIKNYITIEVKDSRDEFIIILDGKGRDREIVNLINRVKSEYNKSKLGE